MLFNPKLIVQDQSIIVQVSIGIDTQYIIAVCLCISFDIANRAFSKLERGLIYGACDAHAVGNLHTANHAGISSKVTGLGITNIFKEGIVYCFGNHIKLVSPAVNLLAGNSSHRILVNNIFSKLYHSCAFFLAQLISIKLQIQIQNTKVFQINTLFVSSIGSGICRISIGQCCICGVKVALAGIYIALGIVVSDNGGAITIVAVQVLTGCPALIDITLCLKCSQVCQMCIKVIRDSTCGRSVVSIDEVINLCKGVDGAIVQCLSSQVVAEGFKVGQRRADSLLKHNLEIVGRIAFCICLQRVVAISRNHSIAKLCIVAPHHHVVANLAPAFDTATCNTVGIVGSTAVAKIAVGTVTINRSIHHAYIVSSDDILGGSIAGILGISSHIEDNIGIFFFAGSCDLVDYFQTSTSIFGSVVRIF